MLLGAYNLARDYDQQAAMEDRPCPMVSSIHRSREGGGEFTKMMAHKSTWRVGKARDRRELARRFADRVCGVWSVDGGEVMAGGGDPL